MLQRITGSCSVCVVYLITLVFVCVYCLCTCLCIYSVFVDVTVVTYVFILFTMSQLSLLVHNQIIRRWALIRLQNESDIQFYTVIYIMRIKMSMSHLPFTHYPCSGNGIPKRLSVPLGRNGTGLAVAHSTMTDSYTVEQ